MKIDKFKAHDCQPKTGGKGVGMDETHKPKISRGRQQGDQTIIEDGNDGINLRNYSALYT